MTRCGAFTGLWWSALAAAGVLAVLTVGGPPAWAAEKVEPIAVNINQSPWFDGFR